MHMSEMDGVKTRKESEHQAPWIVLSSSSFSFGKLQKINLEIVGFGISSLAIFAVVPSKVKVELSKYNAQLNSSFEIGIADRNADAAFPGLLQRTAESNRRGLCLSHTNGKPQRCTALCQTV